MKGALIVLLCIVPLISGKAVDSAPNCYVNYLKNQGFLGGNKGTPLEVTSECLTTVNQSRETEIDKYRQQFLADDDIKQNTECIIGELKETEFFDRELLKHLNMSAAKVGSEQVELSEAFGALASFVHLARALKSCHTTTIFDEEFTNDARSVFDSFFDEEEEEEMDDLEKQNDYCARKFIVDNNQISFNNKDFQINPKHIDTSEVDCEALYQDYLKTTRSALIELFRDEEDDKEDDQQFRDCYAEKVSESHFMDKMLQFEYVKEFGLTTEQREQLRDQFVVLFTQMIKIAIDCHVIV